MLDVKRRSSSLNDEGAMVPWQSRPRGHLALVASLSALMSTPSCSEPTKRDGVDGPKVGSDAMVSAQKREDERVTFHSEVRTCEPLDEAVGGICTRAVLPVGNGSVMIAAWNSLYVVRQEGSCAVQGLVCEGLFSTAREVWCWKSLGEPSSVIVARSSDEGATWSVSSFSPDKMMPRHVAMHPDRGLLFTTHGSGWVWHGDFEPQGLVVETVWRHGHVRYHGRPRALFVAEETLCIARTGGVSLLEEEPDIGTLLCRLMDSGREWHTSVPKFTSGVSGRTRWWATTEDQKLLALAPSRLAWENVPGSEGLAFRSLEGTGVDGDDIYTLAQVANTDDVMVVQATPAEGIKHRWPFPRIFPRRIGAADGIVALSAQLGVFVMKNSRLSRVAPSCEEKESERAAVDQHLRSLGIEQ